MFNDYSWRWTRDCRGGIIMGFILLGVILEIIAFIYLILICLLAYKDKVSVRIINKSIIGYETMMIVGIISMTIGIIIKLI